MAGQSETGERERVPGRLVPPLAGWCASLLLHMAVLVRAVMVATAGEAKPPEPAMCRLSLVVEQKTQMERWPKSVRLPRCHICWPPPPTESMPDWRLPHTRVVGPPDGRIFDPPISERAKVVYIVDRSGSMIDAIDLLKMKFKRALGDLGPENQFDIIFFSNGPVLEMSARRLVTATEVNKRLACEFIDEVTARGDTDPAEAFQRAFAVGAEVIFFLTDGGFDRSVVEQVRRANMGKKAVVNTIAFLYREAEPELRQIAAENGGTFTFVAESDLDP